MFEEKFPAVKNLPEGLTKDEVEQIIFEYDGSPYPSIFLEWALEQMMTTLPRAEERRASKLIFNWLVGDIAAVLNERNEQLVDCSVIDPFTLASLLTEVYTGGISSTTAKQIFAEYISGENTIQSLIEKTKADRAGLDVRGIVATVLSEMPQVVANYKAAEAKNKQKVMGSFIGPIMKKGAGKLDPNEVKTVLAELLSH